MKEEEKEEIMYIFWEYLIDDMLEKLASNEYKKEDVIEIFKKATKKYDW